MAGAFDFLIIALLLAAFGVVMFMVSAIIFFLEQTGKFLFGIVWSSVNQFHQWATRHNKVVVAEARSTAHNHKF